LKVGASVSVVATGTGLSYQWYKDGVAISGATAASYTFTAVTNGFSAYKVRVTNVAGFVESVSVNIGISIDPVAPKITTQPSVSGNKKVGDSITLSVVATGTDLLYQWYKDGTAISGARAASYTFTASTSGTSTYKVRVSSVAGYLGAIDSTAVNISVSEVMVAPTITTQPRGVIKK